MSVDSTNIADFDREFRKRVKVLSLSQAHKHSQMAKWMRKVGG